MPLVWLTKAVVLALHQEQLAEHGGAPGIRDDGALESALARPINRVAYATSTLAELAAAYAYGIARNHPFVDGNKRASFVVADTFLVLNGFELQADDAEIVVMWRALAGGSLSESALADWIAEHLESLS